MSKQHVLVITGTRPDAIKMAPVIGALKQDQRFTCTVCSTGQHQEMLGQVLDWFNIIPDIEMNVMTHNQQLSQLVTRILSSLSDVIDKTDPDTILVHGDTTSSFASALAAHYSYNPYRRKRVKIGHVEAGLRTGDLYNPFPEESNRKLIGALADYHFAPTQTAADALTHEGVTTGIHITGNTVIDALKATCDKLKTTPRDALDYIPADDKIILVTGHRRESYGDGFKNICEALKEIAARYPQAHIVYPVHLNPNVRGPVTDMLGLAPNIHLLRPMDYPTFVAAMQRAYLVLTDSGGLQEEVPSLGKPVLVLREKTERPEAVAAGTARIVGTTTEKIITQTCALMDNNASYQQMATAQNPYGDGKAAARIVSILAGETPAPFTPSYYRSLA